MSNEIGLRIKQYRKSRKMTQLELAKKLGITNSAVSNWESGNNGIDVEMIPEICKALEISPNDLLNTPESNQLPSDALEIAKVYSTLTPPGKELVRSVVAFAEKHHSVRKTSAPDDIPLPRIGTVNGVPLFQMPDDMRLPTKLAAKEEQNEMENAELKQPDNA